MCVKRWAAHSSAQRTSPPSLFPSFLLPLLSLLALTAQIAPARPEHTAGGTMCRQMSRTDPESSISLFTTAIFIKYPPPLAPGQVTFEQ